MNPAGGYLSDALISVRMEYVFQLIIQKIVAISGDGDTVELKGKAIMTVFQYASQRNQDDTRERFLIMSSLDSPLTATCFYH